MTDAPSDRDAALREPGGNQSRTEPEPPAPSEIDLDELQNLDARAISSLATGDEPPPAPGGPKLEAWNPEPGREDVRKYVAYWLLGILSFVVIATVTLIVTERWTKLSTDDVRSTIELVFSPIVTLVSAVIGFYYASNAQSGPGNGTVQKPPPKKPARATPRSRLAFVGRRDRP
ncbi:MAG: hypothetical protein M3Y42_05880 [Actinomycetota bacterium]|nr:hypothetical protein [Actinomycetota bacterium]